VFFAAGVGFNAPVATLEAADRDAAIRVFRAAEALGGCRVILISAYGTESGGPEGYKTGWWKHYYAAKHAAEQALMASTLPWTILRPGGLTDQPGTGRVQLGTHVPFGDIPRADVAAVAAGRRPRPTGEKYSRCIPSGDASPANSASCQEFFPLRPRPQPQQVSPPVPPHLHEHLGERLRPRGMPVPAAIRTSSMTPSMHQPWPTAALRARSHTD
jgi:NAD(P)H-binding